MCGRPIKSCKLERVSIFVDINMYVALALIWLLLASTVKDFFRHCFELSKG